MTKSELLKQFEKGKVVIHSQNESWQVDALIYKGIAVHQIPANWQYDGKWSITHIKSGTSLNFNIGPWPKECRWKALFFAWSLAQEADWTIGQTELNNCLQEYADAAKRAMQYTLSESKV